MTDATFLLLMALSAGLGLGLIYFGGLWLTVSRLQEVRRPGLWMAGSFIVRLAITLAGFYLATGCRWDRLSVCLLGFLFVRWTMVRRIKPVPEQL